jgi:catechol 2,3-dioxygenase-like lactoylglutathione lyase family enzyme
MDLEKSRAFFELLGMTFTKHAHGSGPEHYAHEDELGVFELYPRKEASAAGDHTGLGFSVSNLEHSHVDFAAAGFEPQAIRDDPWGRSFVVRDPDGRRVEVSQK